MIVRLSDMIPGHKMCCICFESIPFDELWVDDNGQKWDICLPCNALETVCIALREYGMDRDQIIDTLRLLTVHYNSARMEP